MRLSRSPLVAALLTVLLSSPLRAQQGSGDLARWNARSAGVTITRDDWGIAHVKGKTDADAVFGMIYAQAEDDFNRIEVNYLNALGRLAEAEGESAIFRDLRMKLFIDPDTLKTLYAKAPADMRELMDAWADGLNFFLASNPQVKPRVLTRFEPWMALSFSEGSIGGDIERVNIAQLQAFYGRADDRPAPTDQFLPTSEPGGSNGVAIAPSNTVSGKALLLINPHTSFYFRSELQMSSEEGLNAYGAVTWGQFFVYQGFNESAGWMHTSSTVDNIDEYLETVTRSGDGYVARYGDGNRPVYQKTITIPYRSADGSLAERSFTTYFTAHGPVVRSQGEYWVSTSLMNTPLQALTQSWTRTKARNYAEFRRTMELHTNSSNNTIFADAEGNIAYFHANFIPRRDTSFNWTRPVDGSDPRTAWGKPMGVEDSPFLLNPASGWLYNANDWPWDAAGPATFKASDFPRYVDNGSSSARGRHAVRLFNDRKDFTLDRLQEAAYDPYQIFFEKPLPALIRAWDGTADSDPLKARLADQIALLRAWDLRASATSVPTLLAIRWAQEAQRLGGRRGGGSQEDALAAMPAPQLLQALASASDRIAADFGTWRTPWGEYNRFQRLTDDIVHPFDDSQPSIPVSFTSASPWGSLASFAASSYRGSRKIYGTSGNSFVAVVEFGDSVRARAITAGGESGDPSSKHFRDQAERYANGDLREVYFYPNQLLGHTERVYRPGEKG